MKALISAVETTKASDVPAQPKRRATSKRVDKPAPVTATPARKGTKGARIIALLQKPSGASLKGLMKATGWQRAKVDKPSTCAD